MKVLILGFAVGIVFHLGVSIGQAAGNVEEPDAPGKPYIVDWDRNRVELDWDPPINDGGSPLLGYIIRKRESGSPFWSGASQAPADQSHVTVHDLVEAQQYEFHVTALNAAGQSEPSEASDKVETGARKPFENEDFQVAIYGLDALTQLHEKIGEKLQFISNCIEISSQKDGLTNESPVFERIALLAERLREECKSIASEMAASHSAGTLTKEKLDEAIAGIDERMLQMEQEVYDSSKEYPTLLATLQDAFMVYHDNRSNLDIYDNSYYGNKPADVRNNPQAGPQFSC